jgi:hypothetical protein
MSPPSRHDLIDQVASWLHAFDGSPLIPDDQLLQQREAYRARATQVVAAVRKFDGSDNHRALLAQHVVEHLTRVEVWRVVLCNALLSVAEGFEANGDEYEKSRASDPGRQYELAAAADAWRDEILNPPSPPSLAPDEAPF